MVMRGREYFEKDGNGSFDGKAPRCQSFEKREWYEVMKKNIVSKGPEEEEKKES